MNEQEAYVAGFYKTAADNGVDPEWLMKVAFKSTPLNEALLGATVPAILPKSQYLYTPAQTIGEIAGLFSDPSNEQTEGMTNFLPGVSSYKWAHRLKSQALNQRKRFGKHHEVGNTISEALGGTANLLGMTGLGALAGAALNKSDPSGGAIAGSLVGGGTSLAAGLIGAIAAGIKRRRTAEEQAEHDKTSRVLSNLLIPGHAAYDVYKRIGRSQGDRDEAEEKKSKSSKKD